MEGGSMVIQPSGFRFGNLLSFERMLTPVIIRVVYLLGIILCVFFGLGAALRGGDLMALIGGIFGMVIGIFSVRIACEALIVAFQINETLSDIKRLLQKQASP